MTDHRRQAVKTASGWARTPYSRDEAVYTASTGGSGPYMLTIGRFAGQPLVVGTTLPVGTFATRDR